MQKKLKCKQTWKHFDVVLGEVSIWPVVFQIRALTTFLFLQIVSQLLEKWPHPPCTPSKPEKRKRRKYFALYIRNGPQSGPESVEEESSKTNFCKNLSQK